MRRVHFEDKLAREGVRMGFGGRFILMDATIINVRQLDQIGYGQLIIDLIRFYLYGNIVTNCKQN